MGQPSEILNYIPQREPIVMVSELCSANENEVFTKLFIDKSNIFCDNGYLQEPGIIENIAQTAAAMTGYNAHKSNTEVKRGFIGSINNLIIYNLPQSGTEIETHVHIQNMVMNVHIIHGMVTQNKVNIAECTMKIFLEE